MIKREIKQKFQKILSRVFLNFFENHSPVNPHPGLFREVRSGSAGRDFLAALAAPRTGSQGKYPPRGCRRLNAQKKRSSPGGKTIAPQIKTLRPERSEGFC